MENMDPIVCYYHDNSGTAVHDCVDYYGTGKESAPDIDSSQDVTYLSTDNDVFDGSKITWKFTRPITKKESDNDNDAAESWVWATGSTTYSNSQIGLNEHSDAGDGKISADDTGCPSIAIWATDVAKLFLLIVTAISF